MVEFMKQHLGVILAIVVFATLFALAKDYGKAGGVMDKQFQQTFDTVGEQGKLAFGGESDGGK